MGDCSSWGRRRQPSHAGTAEERSEEERPEEERPEEERPEEERPEAGRLAAETPEGKAPQLTGVVRHNDMVDQLQASASVLTFETSLAGKLRSSEFSA